MKIYERWNYLSIFINICIFKLINICKYFKYV